MFDASKEIAPQFEGVRVVIDQGGHASRSVIDAGAAAGVELWQVLGTGLDHTDVDYILQQDIALANTPGPFSAIALAEHAMSLMLNVAKKTHEADRNLRNGTMYLPVTEELHGSTLGLVGLGASARELAVRARAFAMRVIAVDVFAASDADLAELGVDWYGSPADLAHLLEESDYVSLHVPLTRETRHMISAEMLARMKPTAVLINVARGAIVDEGALAAALSEGRLRGVRGIDASLGRASPTRPSLPHPRQRRRNASPGRSQLRRVPAPGSRLRREHATCGEGRAAALPDHERGVIELDARTAGPYLQEHGVAPPDTEVTVKELGWGISNVVLRASWPGACIVVKQSLPKLRVEDDWPFDRDRIVGERDCMEYLAALLPPGSVPDVVFSDDPSFAFGMTCVPGEGVLWKQALLDGQIDVEAARRAGRLLAAVHRESTGDGRARERFASQTVLIQGRLDPYHLTAAEAHPELAPRIHAEVERLLATRRALVLGDYSPKNLFVYPTAWSRSTSRWPTGGILPSTWRSCSRISCSRRATGRWTLSAISELPGASGKPTPPGSARTRSRPSPPRCVSSAAYCSHASTGSQRSSTSAPTRRRSSFATSPAA